MSRLGTCLSLKQSVFFDADCLMEHLKASLSCGLYEHYDAARLAIHIYRMAFYDPRHFCAPHGMDACPIEQCFQEGFGRLLFFFHMFDLCDDLTNLHTL